VLTTFWKYRPVRHAVVWLGAWAAFYTMVRFAEGHVAALRITTPMMLAGPLPVYAHFAALRRLFERRRYLAYAISVVVIAAVSTVWAEFIHSLIDPDPDSHTNGLGVTVLFMTASTGFRYFSRGVGQQYRLQEAEFKQLQTEMALLRSQVDPHFMFNTLNNLYALSLDGSPRLPEMILKLSELMRYLLDSSHRRTVTLADEIRFIENYVELEKIRLDEGADVHLRVQGDPGARQVAPMLMIPFVENCFKHGLGTGERGNRARIDIVIEIADGEVRFTAENDVAVNSAGSIHGVGLLNLQRRLALLYPERHRLTIDDGAESYKVEMTLWV
jgi:hypothetical protein